MPAGDLLRLFQRATQAAVTAARGEAVATGAAKLAARASRGLFGARIPTALAFWIGLCACGAAAVIAFWSDRGPRAELAPAITRAIAPTPQAPAEARRRSTQTTPPPPTSSPAGWSISTASRLTA